MSVGGCIARSNRQHEKARRRAVLFITANRARLQDVSFPASKTDFHSSTVWIALWSAVLALVPAWVRGLGSPSVIYGAILM